MIIQGRVSGTTKEPLTVKYQRNQSMRERMCKGIPLSIATIKQTQLSVKNENLKTLTEIYLHEDRFSFNLAASQLLCKPKSYSAFFSS